MALVEARPIASAVTGHSTAKVSALHETQYTQISRGVGREAAAAYAAAQPRWGRQDQQSSLPSTRSSARWRRRRTTSCAQDEERRREGRSRGGGGAGAPASRSSSPTRPTFPSRFGPPLRLDASDRLRLRSVHAGPGRRRRARGRFASTRRAGCASVKHGSPCVLRLESGAELEADRVVLATHMPLLDRGLFFARLRPQASYAVSAPAADAPAGMYLGTRRRHALDPLGADAGRLALSHRRRRRAQGRPEGGRRGLPEALGVARRPLRRRRRSSTAGPRTT